MSRVLKSAFQRAFVKPNRRASLRRGRLERIESFESAVLANRRIITIYLPPGYDEPTGRRYPVLYLQDGQNLFEPQRAFIRGQHWRLAEAADDVIGARKSEPMIIVGIDNTGAQRVDEYTPARDEARAAGGRAEEYGQMLLGELKPLVDARYRTLPEREQTAIGGSSLGGLVSLFLALRHPDAFGRAMVMSPSVWWGGRTILREIERIRGRALPRVWLDVGGREGEEALRDVRLLRDRMQLLGWNPSNFRYYEDRRGDHSERAWARRVPMALEFLFPA